MGIHILLIGVVHVVCHHQRNIQLFGKLHQLRIDNPLLCNPVVLHFQKIIVRAKAVPVFYRSLFRLPDEPLYNVSLHLSRKAGGKRNNPLMELV